MNSQTPHPTHLDKEEILSAWIDNETSDNIDWVNSAQEWETYHLIRECLQEETLPLKADFMTRFQARLAEEPTLVAPIPQKKKSPSWISVALAASAAFIAVSAWFSLSRTPEIPVVAPSGSLAQQQDHNTAQNLMMISYSDAHQTILEETTSGGDR